MLRVIALSVAVLIATPALAGPANQPATVAQPAPPAAQASAQDKKVCRRESVMGSIMPKRTCHTAAEWSAIDRANNSVAQQAFDNRRTNAAQ